MVKPVIIIFDIWSSKVDADPRIIVIVLSLTVKARAKIGHNYNDDVFSGFLSYFNWCII